MINTISLWWERPYFSLQEITQTVRTPLIAFTGDTTLDYLNGNLGPEILNAKLLIMEITTLDDLLSPQETKVSSFEEVNILWLYLYYLYICLSFQLCLQLLSPD